MTVRSEIDEEEERRRSAPMGDISPESVAAGDIDDDEPESVREFPEIDLTEQAPQGASDVGPPSFTDSEDFHALGPSAELPSPGAALAKAFTSPGQTQAAERMQEIASRRYKPSAGLSDDAIAKARAERRAAIGRNDFTRAIQAALLRKPFSPTDPEDEAGDLLRMRQAEQHSFERQQDRDVSLQQTLAKLLKGEKAPALTPYQQEALERQKRIDAQKAADDARKTASDTEKTEAEKAATEELRREVARYTGRPLEEIAKWDRKTLERVYSQTGSDRRAAMLAKEREGVRETKATEDVPPGYEIAPGSNPGPESRKKFTALVASQQKMKELTSAMRRELAGAGALDRMLPGEKRRRLQQLATQLRIEAKNVAELGALSGPDMALMEAMATDPTSLSSLAGGSLEANLKGLDAWGDSSVRAGEKAYGLRRVVPDGDPVVTLVAKDGRTKRVKKSAADAYLKAHPGEATVQ